MKNKKQKTMKITYQRAYSIGPFLQEKIGFEVDVDFNFLIEDDKVQLTLLQLKNRCDKAHKELNPGLYITNTQTGEVSTGYDQPQPIPEVQIEKPAASIESTITDIQNCKDLAELDTYRLVAALDPKVKEVYDEKYLQLYNNQVTK
jgi:hypothetical protein